MALELSSGLASSGAGYDDYDNNAYRDSEGVGDLGKKPPTWETVGHRKLSTSVADKIFKCKRRVV